MASIQDLGSYVLSSSDKLENGVTVIRRDKEKLFRAY